MICVEFELWRSKLRSSQKCDAIIERKILFFKNFFWLPYSSNLPILSHFLIRCGGRGSSSKSVLRICITLKFSNYERENVLSMTLLDHPSSPANSSFRINMFDSIRNYDSNIDPVSMSMLRLVQKLSGSISVAQEN